VWTTSCACSVSFGRVDRMIGTGSRLAARRLRRKKVWSDIFTRRPRTGQQPKTRVVTQPDVREKKRRYRKQHKRQKVRDRQTLLFVPSPTAVAVGKHYEDRVRTCVRASGRSYTFSAKVRMSTWMGPIVAFAISYRYGGNVQCTNSGRMVSPGTLVQLRFECARDLGGGKIEL
jgi:hypothetical protein